MHQEVIIIVLLLGGTNGQRYPAILLSYFFIEVGMIVLISIAIVIWIAVGVHVGPQIGTYVHVEVCMVCMHFLLQTAC
jgi:hypothetical protein